MAGRRFDQRVVVITGASRGLGRAMALGYAREGATVVVSSRDVDRCRAVVDEIEGIGGRGLAVAANVGEWDHCTRLVELTLASAGRIDVLVNNAGIAPVPPSIGGITENLFDRTIAVNLKGPLRLIGLASPHMPRGSAILNISSHRAIRATPETIVYGAAKAGLNAITRAASIELAAAGIRVNAIMCGPFLTEGMQAALPTEADRSARARSVALGRLGEPEEIVGTALWATSAESSFLTGECILLDGGPSPAGAEA